MTKLPTISIITPSLNQGDYIEETIRSVLSQNYPRLEYVVIDGGSTDQTKLILRQYSKELKWISQRDRGQSDAINKGLAMTSGDIVGFINSDDFLLPNALFEVGKIFAQNQKVMWLTGKCHIVDAKGQPVRQLVTWYKNIFLKYWRHQSIFKIVQFVSQPATFWRRRVGSEVGKFDISLYYNMDYDYWLRIWQRYPLEFIDKYLAAYRVHATAKAMESPQTQFQVAYEIVKRYSQAPILLWLNKLHASIAVTIYAIYNHRIK